MKTSSLKENFSGLMAKAESVPFLTIQEILEEMKGKSRLLLLLFLSIPFCQPIPIPGLSTIFGLIVALIGLRFAFGKKIWLPQKILRRKISSESIRKVATKGMALIEKLRPLIRPRYGRLFQNPAVNLLHGAIFVVMGLLLALPLPIPFTNLTAGWSIFLIALGLLENDGLFITLGYVVAFLTILFFAFLLFLVNPSCLKR